jgi:hypothetical protein
MFMSKRQELEILICNISRRCNLKWATDGRGKVCIPARTRSEDFPRISFYRNTPLYGMKLLGVAQTEREMDGNNVE